LKNILFFIFILFSSCGQNYNSNSNDEGVYGNIGITPGSNLYNAYVVMQAKCFACHGDQWKDYKTSNDWIEKGLIVSGSTVNSSIYTSLTNNGGSMPKNPYPPLTKAEVETLKTWINSP
jgi:hypothetical protein